MSLMTRSRRDAEDSSSTPELAPADAPGAVEVLEQQLVEEDLGPLEGIDDETEIEDDSGVDVDEPQPATQADTPKRTWRDRVLRRGAIKQLKGDFAAYPHLLALKPREGYVFRSDFFQVDGSYACVLAFFHDDGAIDGFYPFWGIDRITTGANLDETVTVILLEQVRRMSKKWIDQHTKNAERLDNLDAAEQDEAGTRASKRKSAKVSADMEELTGELQDGATYLSAHFRLLVKAPDLATLDDSIERIGRLYIDRFATLKVEPYAGEQLQELSSLLAPNDKKRGNGFHFTSTEFAGAYSLVTNGLNDPTGEYVGYMVGDVNNSAVLLDVNDYETHVVVADNAVEEMLDRSFVADMWGSKLSQACLLNNGHVVHLVLDGADLDRLGPRLDGVTARVDLNRGDVNMFEMFGDPSDELTVFAVQMEKLRLMFEQVYDATDSDRSIIRGELEKTATAFYVDQNMWVHNAGEQRERLRLVNLPHDQVPRLQMFVSYLDMTLKSLRNNNGDREQIHAYNVLSVVARNLLSTNGDLFNNITADAIDGVRDARRVVYDFSQLMLRGHGIAMAQLVNIVGFAVGKMERGDTVIIHGAQLIDAGVKDYLATQLGHLRQRGGRIVFLYTDIDAMLKDSEFNKFDAADYIVLGAMRDGTVARYEELLHQQIPLDLKKQITKRGENLSYLRRGVSNVVFHLDLALGVNPERAAARRTQLATDVSQAQRNQRVAPRAATGPDRGVAGVAEGTGDGVGDSAPQRPTSSVSPAQGLTRRAARRQPTRRSSSKGQD